MGVASNILNIAGLVFLSHAVYSAYEHALLPQVTDVDTPLTTSQAPLPLDITIETLISVLLLCVGIVLGAPELKPIQWRVWAGKIEKEKRKPLKDLSEGLGGNPYIGLEERVGFLDIRAQRKEFGDWIRDRKQ